MKYFLILENFLLAHKKNVGRILFLGLSLWALVLLHNRLQFNIQKSHVDEGLTINLGVNSMYTGKVDNLRVGESTRWLARLIHPIGLFYMNSHMGGEHYVTGWDYPSGYYLQKNFQDIGDIFGDPNLGDYVFAMRFVLGALVILSFLLASYLTSIRFGFIAGLFYFSFAMSSMLINDMLLIFYTESTLVILFNVIIAFAFTSHVNTMRLYIWLAFIFAFALSAKLTGILFILPVIMILKQKEGTDWIKGLRIEAFALLIILFLWLINIDAISYMSLLDQTLANIYHYKTGHYYTTPSGSYQVKEMFSKIPVWSILFPLALTLILLFKTEHKKIVLSIAIVAALILASSFGMSLFVERNLTTPLVMIIFVVSIALSLVFARFDNKKFRYVSIAGIIIYFCACCIDYYRPINESCVDSFGEKFKNIALIDVSKKYYPNATVLNSMPESFVLSEQQPQLIDQFLPYDCVIIKRVKNNKHYTNYILPMGYYLISRYGDYFVFQQRNELKTQLKKIQELKKYTPLREGKFKLYQIDSSLVLYKGSCMKDQVNQRFFMHIIPINKSDLDSNTAHLGVNGRDFNFPDSTFINGQVYLTVPLPKYPIKSIDIGQFAGDTRLWREEISFTK